MEKEIELLPCPFCGGPGYLCQIPSASGGDRFIWVAKCSAEEGCGVKFLGCSRKVDAIKEWNRRDREARLVEALEGWVDYHKSLRGGQIAGCPGNGYGGSCTDSGGYPDGLDNANPSQICDFHKLLRSTHKALAEYRGEK